MAETKVILTKSVNHLGHPGDVVAVKSGYARNYLFPQGLAFAWSKCRRPDRGHEARSSGQGRRHPRRGCCRQGIIEFHRRNRCQVSESGKLFGGISAEKIAIALSSKVEVNPKNITVEPIKTTGDFPATVALHPEITANFFVKVVAE